MDLKDYLQILNPKLWLLLLGAALAALACYFVAARFTNWPLYEARATLLIENEATLSSTQTAEGLEITRQTIRTIATRPPLTQKIVDLLELPMEEEDLAALLRLHAPTNTSVIEVVVSYSDPIVTANIANMVAEELVSMRSDTVGLSPAHVPLRPELASYLILIIAGAFGFTISVGGVLLGEYFNDTIRNEKDVEHRIDIPLLGKIDCSPQSSAQMYASFKSHRWIYFHLFANKKSISDTLFVTSPKVSTHQPKFVNAFMKCNLEQPPLPSFANEISLTPSEESEMLMLSTQLNGNGSDIGDDQIIAGNIQFDLQPTTTTLTTASAIDDVSTSALLTELLGTDEETQLSRVIDGPPVLSDIDAVVLARRYGNVLLVLDANNSRISDARKAIHLLEKSGASVVGAVLLT